MNQPVTGLHDEEILFTVRIDGKLSRNNRVYLFFASSCRACTGREADITPILREFSDAVAREGASDARGSIATLVERDQCVRASSHRGSDFRCSSVRYARPPAFRRGDRKWLVEGREVDYLRAMS